MHIKTPDQVRGDKYQTGCEFPNILSLQRASRMSYRAVLRYKRYIFFILSFNEQILPGCKTGKTDPVSFEK